MAKKYAVATGNAADDAVWSASSGGEGGAGFTAATDQAVFDAASGNITVTIAAPLTVNTDADSTTAWNMVGFTGTLAVNAALRVNGCRLSGTITGSADISTFCLLGTEDGANFAGYTGTLVHVYDALSPENAELALSGNIANPAIEIDNAGFAPGFVLGTLSNGSVNSIASMTWTNRTATMYCAGAYTIGAIVVSANANRATILASAAGVTIGSVTVAAGGAFSCGGTSGPVKVTGNISIDAAAVCDNLGAWQKTASGNVANPTAGNAFGALTINAGVTATTTGDVQATALTNNGVIRIAASTTLTAGMAFGRGVIYATGTLDGMPGSHTNTSAVVIGGTVNNCDLTGQTALLHLYPAAAGTDNTNVTEISPSRMMWARRRGRA